MSNELSKYIGTMPEGWYLADGKHKQVLEQELKIELHPNHLLAGTQVQVVAYRKGTDDILCWHVNEPKRFTVIHLSWLGKQEINAKHPSIEADGSFADFLNYERQFLGG
ncbi:MAG: hypothetical protein AAF614_13810 [Chloroflexota bacterium]